MFLPYLDWFCSSSIQIQWCYIVIGGINFIQKRGFVFFVVACRLFCERICAISTKKGQSWLSIVEGKIEHVNTTFAHIQPLKLEISLVWKVRAAFVFTFKTKQIFDILLNFLVLWQIEYSFLSIFGGLKWSVSGICLPGHRLIFFGEEK